MKSLYKILITASLVFPAIVFSQEPVIFYYNFTFYTNSSYYFEKLVPNENIKVILLKIFNSKNQFEWVRDFDYNELLMDNNGSCLMIDTIENLVNSDKFYKLSVNYVLFPNKVDSCEFSFIYPDTVKNLALELFFDQALIVKSGSYELPLLTFDEYTTDPTPKPVLIVKYLKPDEEIFLEPTWFDYYRITKRPKYIMHNNSNYGISTATKNMFSCFFGKLMYLDSNNQWGPYPYGGMCGTINCNDVLGVGHTFQAVEGYPIGNPRKLREGYYRYFVPFKDIAGIVKSTDTYFSVYSAK